jgi:D-glycero-D-manno-heptose 1,7-bisphosphate phosphatase
MIYKFKLYTLVKMEKCVKPILFILVGFPGSGKSTIAKKYAEDYEAVIVSRDTIGGTVASLYPIIQKHLADNKNVIVDNLHLTIESRAPYFAIAKKYGATIHAIYLKSTIENCQINIIRRKTQPPIPPVVLFSARKNLQEPTLDEGFTAIFLPKAYVASWTDKPHKAIFLDIDGTLRASDHLPNKYPTVPEQVELIKSKEILRAVIDRYVAEGYILVGVSNQSGIAKGTLTAADAKACFDRTLELLGLDFPVLFCPHKSSPITCYCRKPQSGLFIQAAEKYGINISESTMIGDLKTDETAAERLGMKFIYADKAFA